MKPEEFEKAWAKIDNKRQSQAMKSAAYMVIVRGYKKSDSARFQKVDSSHLSKIINKLNMNYLNHITLTTGHTRKSPRSEVGGGIIQALAPLVEALQRGEKTPIPVEGYSINGANAGENCVIWTIWHQDGAPVATLALALKSRCGANLWRAIHDMETPDHVATDRGDVPAAPWLAARLHIGSTLHPDCAEWLGDFERCLAWAWIEREKHD